MVGEDSSHNSDDPLLDWERGRSSPCEMPSRCVQSFACFGKWNFAGRSFANLDSKSFKHLKNQVIWDVFSICYNRSKTRYQKQREHDIGGGEERERLQETERTQDGKIKQDCGGNKSRIEHGESLSSTVVPNNLRSQTSCLEPVGDPSPPPEKCTGCTNGEKLWQYRWNFFCQIQVPPVGESFCLGRVDT